MRKLLIGIAIVLAFALNVEARGLMMIQGGPVAAAACSTTPAGTGGDLFNFGFETGESGTWTQGANCGAALVVNASYPAGWTPPTNGCSKLARTNTSSTSLECSYIDLGEAKGEVYIQFYMYIDSITVADWSGFVVMAVNNNTDPNYAGSGADFVIGKATGSSLTMASTGAAATAMAIDTQYLVEVHYKNDNGAASIGYRIDGGSWNTAQSNYTGARYIHFGRCSNTNTASLDAYFDIIRVDDDGTYNTTP
jgi:hypothetical protein